MKIQHSTKLMKNQKHALVMPPTASFTALQTGNGHSLFFSIGTDDILYVIAEEPGSTTGWVPKDLCGKLAPAGKKAKIKAFDLSENPATSKIDLAVVATIEGIDLLYTSLGNNNADVRWCDTLAWTHIPYDDKAHTRAEVVIQNVLIRQSGLGEFIMVDILRDPKSAIPFLFRYFIDASGSGRAWNPNDFSADLDAVKIQTALGRRDELEYVDASYTFGSIKNKKGLWYTPLLNAFDPEIAPSPTKLSLPDNTTAMALAKRADGYTDLYLAAGDGIYLYRYNKQNNEHQPQLVCSNALFKGIVSLHANTTGCLVSIWGLNQNKQVFYITSENGEDNWTHPVPILSGVNQVTAYQNTQTDGSVLFANLSGKKLIQLSRDPVSSMWLQREILLPPTAIDNVTEVNTYSTHIRTTDDSNLPLSNQLLNIRGTGMCSLYINNEYYTLSSDQDLEVTSDDSGNITIIQEVNTIGAICYHITAGNIKIAINPMTAILETMATIKSADDLANVQVTDKNGEKRYMVPKDTPLDQVEATAHALEQFVKIGHEMPEDGSVEPKRRVHPAGKELFKQMIQNTDKLWGVSFAEGGWQYREGRAVLSYLGINESMLSGDASAMTLDIPGFSNSFTSVAGDIFNWLKDQFNAATDFVVGFAEGVYYGLIKIAGQVYNFVINCVNAVVQAAEFVFNKIKVFIEDLIKWLGFIFQWKDIVRTKKAIKNILKLSIHNSVDTIDQTKSTVSSTFKDIKHLLDEWAGFGPIPGDLASTAAKTETPGENSPEANWGNYHMQNGAADTRINKSVQPAAGGDLEHLFKELEALMAQQGESFKEIGQMIQDQIIGQIATLSVGQLVKRIIAIIGRLLVTSVETVVLVTLDILKIMIGKILEILDAPIEIPVISWLYKEVTGDHLSLLDAVCLVVAIPATIIFKLIKNRAPYPDNSFTQAIINAKNYQQLKAAFNPRSNVAKGDLLQSISDGAVAARIIATFGSVLLIGFSIKKKVSIPSATISILHGASFFLATMPAFVDNLVEAEQNPWVLIGEGAYSVTILQKMLDMYHYMPSPTQHKWNSLSQPLDAFLGGLGLVAVIGGIIKKAIDSKATTADIVLSVGNVSWNINRILTPFVPPGPIPTPPFKAKMGFIGVSGACQFISCCV